MAAGEPCRQIAARLRRAPSTVSRELARNGGRVPATGPRPPTRRPSGVPSGPSLPSWSWSHGFARWSRPSWRLRWSPQQIAGWLPLAYPQDPVMRVSHETIYLSLFVQSRGALRRELQRCLRTGRAMRYPRGKRLPQGRGQLRDTLPISQRPAGGGRPGGARALGRRPGAWQAAQRGRDPGRAPQPLCDAVPPARWVHRPAHASGPDRCCPPTAPAAAPLPHLGSRSRRWPSTCSSPSTPASRSISVTRAAPGSGAPTRTPTACSANTSPRVPTSASSTRPR